MTTTLYGDLETFSEVPIKHGHYKYAENAEVMLASYALDDLPVKVWDRTANPIMPDDLAEALADDSILVVFQNSMFDRTVMRLSMGIEVPLERWHDTMVQALAHSLPGGLAKLCAILNVPVDQRKLDVGRQLIHLFCKPRPKNMELRRATRATHPREWQQFVDYAGHDVEAMRAIHRRLPTWNYSGTELDLWHLDQRINDRGMAVDVALAAAAIRTVEREKRRLAKRSSELTSGEVEATTQRDRLIKFILREHGIDLPDVQASTLERRIEDPELPEEAKELMRNRLQASSTSPAKYKALMNAVCADGRLRGTKQFCGAGRTARWSGRVFQPDNLMRVPKHIKPIYDDVIEAIKADGIDLVFDNAMEAMASVVRGSIIPGPGKKFAISDLSNIEGRKLAWLADEGWKLEAFRAFDAGEGHDMYALGYARSFGGTPQEVMADDKAGGIKRQVGKVQELALGYQGGVGAYVTMAATYKLDIERLVAEAAAWCDRSALVKAREAWKGAVEKNLTYDLSENAYTVIHALVQMWRMANNNIRTLWYELERGVSQAIRSPGNIFTVGRLKMVRDGAWLRIRLPSGRFLCYPDPRFDDTGKITYMGVNQYTKKWSRISTYGGKLAENVTQACARDVLAAALPRVEAAGYEIVLHVHDEVVTEIDEGASDEVVAGLGVILRTNPDWADGLPLAANSYSAMRYRKED